MKMTIIKQSSFTVDIDKERERIKEAFQDRPVETEKLNHLMDLIEAEKWKEAGNELEGEWWQGRDKELECPRLEFIGMLNSEGDANPWDTYSNLIWKILLNPGKYSVKTVKTVKKGD